MTYQQLNERSNQLARHIRRQYKARKNEELTADTLIALCLDKSLEMVIGILGVLKAGGAYVPIDPDYPQERLDYILQDTNSSLVLTQRKVNTDNGVQLPEEKVIHIDLSEEFYIGEDSSNLPANNTSKDLAYVIYTSGTTGKPKGVMIEHLSVSNTIDALYDAYKAAQRITVYTSYVFDVFTAEIFAALVQGSELHILAKYIRTDSIALSAYFVDNKINMVYLPPVLLAQLPQKSYPDLNSLLYAGEPCDKQTASIWSRKTRLFNYYGPTETSIYSIYKQILSDEVEQIGKPIQNTKVYVLDAELNPVPIGIIGELYIGGAGLSRGYLNNEALTTERFIDNPFATELDRSNGYTRLYKTGDLVRWLPHGNLEYIGRNDDQVKIRGYRIESAEIEYALLQIPGIKQSCVLVKEKETESGKNKYLVGYYVSDNEDLEENLILEKLSDVLPEYMVPSALVRMENFPLTVNGKLDKRSLPDADFNSTGEEYTAPVTEIEKVLCGIWGEVLGVERVGVTTNFFRIGGDSIVSMQLSGRIRQAGYDCQVKDIFLYKTVGRLAKHLSISGNSQTKILSEQGALSGELGLLPVQQWFTEEVSKGIFRKPDHWNQSFLIKGPVLDTVRLSLILEELAGYHDVLRIQYGKGEEWKQVYQAAISLPELKILDVSEYSESEIHEILTGWQSGFDLEQGPLYQAGYLHGYKDGSARIYMALHHMIVDTVSWRILAEDIKTLYEGKQLGDKGSSYRQWVSCVRSYDTGHEEQYEYWQEQLSGMPLYQEPEDAVQRGVSMELPESLTTQLLQESSGAYHTQINDLLLTALAYALKDLNGSGIQGITLEGHGREHIDDSINHSRTVGWFTTMFPVKLVLGENIKESIRGIKESLRTIPDKGIGFGVFATRNGSSYSHDDLPAIVFNYLGQFDSSEGDWQIVAEGSGRGMHPDNRDTNLASINGRVIGRKLQFNIVTRLGKTATEQLGENFHRWLIAIIDHCKDTLENKGLGYTPVDFTTVHLNQSLIDRLQVDAWADKNQVEQIYPANSLQQGFIYHALSQPEDDAYRVQALYDYHHPLDIDKYISAWQMCIVKYPILRTAFNWEEEVIQVIYMYGKLEYTIHDISDLHTIQQKDDRIEAIRISDRKQGFDLGRPTLLRLHIIKQSADHYTIIETEHHSISDGWSGPILRAEVHRYYHALIRNEKITIEQDSAYLETQEYISRNKSRLSDYWEQVLGAVESANDINGLLSSPIDVDSYRQVEQPCSAALEVKDKLYERLKLFSRREGITVNVIVQFIWHKLLQVYSHAEQSIVGTTVSGRDLPVESMDKSVGLYINTLPLVINWANDKTIREQLQYIQEEVTALNTNSFAELAKLQKGGQRLFHSLFVFENYPVIKTGSNDVLKISLRKVAGKVDYALNILSYEHPNSLTVRLQYDGKHLTEERAGEHMATLKNILSQVLENPEEKHTQISLLSSEEYRKIVYEWNQTDKEYDKDKTIHELFEEQAAKTPGNIALVYEGQELTYQQLNERSNQLARYIRTQYKERKNEGIKSDTLIALCLERSLEMVIGILGVLKAGGAYVPIDPSYPKERIDYMLEDTKAALVLSQRQLNENSGIWLPEEKIIYIDLSEEQYKKTEVSNLPAYSASSDVAYVIYTSGTTGKPKGVMVEHRSIANYNEWMFSHHCYTNSHIVDCSSSISFDATVNVLLTPLCHGKQVVICAETVKQDIDLYLDHIHRHKIELIKLTPGYLSVLLNATRYYTNKLGYLQCIIIGGEKANKPEVEEFIRLNPSIKILHHYGPTETTVGVTSFTDFANKTITDQLTSVPLGKIAINTKAYILDQYNYPVPVGVTGELYIGGTGLSRGYLNNAELTSERFIKNPFATELDKSNGYTRLYKTGDLVRWLPHGNLEYIGRNDDQVKIRGHRIELAEIEHALLQIPGIKQSCVLVKEKETESGKNKYLVGYYVSDNEDLEENGILDKISKVLPHYMMPAVIIKKERFPLTVNGKLDKLALPEGDQANLSKEYIAPTTEIERVVCKIWEEILGLKRISVTDDFFRIGGDSIMSMQVSGRIRQVGYNCQVKDIFLYKTVAKLSKHIRINGESKIKIVTEYGRLTGEFGLLPIQQWFSERVNNGSFDMPSHWNQSFLIKVPVLNTVRLSSILEELVGYHDVLRIRYGKGDEWRQVYQSVISLPELKILYINQYADTEIYEILTHWQSGFDLENGPLYQAGYLCGYEDGSARIYFALHHMIVDAVSWRILTEDIRMLYEGKKLPNKGSSYRQWVACVRSYEKQHEEEYHYWKEQLNGIQLLKVNTEEKMILSRCSLELPENITTTLLQEISEAYHTEINDLLLTALAYALKDMDGDNIHGITLEGHGRENIDESIDHSRLVGWFTTQFPVKLVLGVSIKDSIRSIKEKLRTIPNKGIGFGVFATKTGSAYSHNDLPPITFNYLGQFDNNEGSWHLVSETSGMSMHPGNKNRNFISINAMVTGSKLCFNISTRLSDKVTKQLKENLRTWLISIIEHCKNTLDDKEGGYTTADFKTVRLSQSLLDRLQFGETTYEE